MAGIDPAVAQVLDLAIADRSVRVGASTAEVVGLDAASEVLIDRLGPRR